VVVKPGSACDEVAVSGSAMLAAVPSTKVKTSLHAAQHATSAACQSISNISVAAHNVASMHSQQLHSGSAEASKACSEQGVDQQY